MRLTVSDDGGDIGAERLNDIRKSLDAERGSAIGFVVRNVHERHRHYVPQYGLSVTSASRVSTPQLPYWHPFEPNKKGEDGATALRLYTEERPDMILLDINLPDMSGLNVAKTIREKDQQTPLLFLTGYESMTYIRQAVSLQAVDYWLKPVTSEEEAVHRHRSLEPLYRVQGVSTTGFAPAVASCSRGHSAYPQIVWGGWSTLYEQLY